MSNLKQLVGSTDKLIQINHPFDDSELLELDTLYSQLTRKEFNYRFRELWNRPIDLTIQEKKHSLQFNFCTDPFCYLYGLPQEVFPNPGYRERQRYRLSGSTKTDDQSLVCNEDNPTRYISKTSSKVLSNWSIADEIGRLIKKDTVEEVEPTYKFHREGCLFKDEDPFNNKKQFHFKGTSSSNSKKYKCKSCGKMTNVLPNQRECFSYHQQRNDILLDFAKLVLNRNPVRRTCEILEIGISTYYKKLEWLYQKCLEFLERHEVQSLKSASFKELWLNTDQFVYYLNNVRKKGSGGLHYDNLEDPYFQTYAVVTADNFSRYVFRSDLAFDWDVTLEDIESNTQQFKANHLPENARRYGRLRISYAPHLSSKASDEDKAEYHRKLATFNKRKDYLDGLHVKSVYTSIAHFWILKNLLNVKEWRFVTDADYSIMSAVLRVFMSEIRSGYAHYFLCYTDREKSLKASYAECKQEIKKLKSFALENEIADKSLYKIGLEKLKDDLKSHPLCKQVSINNMKYNIPTQQPIAHPIPTIDQGLRLIDVATDLSGYHIDDLAKVLMKVSNNSTNAFMQQIRRRLSILERPLVTARLNSGKSYIYSNHNPKYAQYALTILRTYYNFCIAFKSKGGQKATPAQRLGIANRQYELKDIIYFS